MKKLGRIAAGSALAVAAGAVPLLAVPTPAEAADNSATACNPSGLCSYAAISCARAAGVVSCDGVGVASQPGQSGYTLVAAYVLTGPNGLRLDGSENCGWAAPSCVVVAEGGSSGGTYQLCSTAIRFQGLPVEAVTACTQVSVK